MNQKDEIIEIFFGTQSGELPENLIEIQKEYLKAKEDLGEGCSGCQLNGLMRQYKNRIKKLIS
jgi:hypothetical protein